MTKMPDISQYSERYGRDDEWQPATSINSLPAQSNGTHRKREAVPQSLYRFPPAADLAAYNNAFEDGARLVFMMAQEQMKHRQERERRVSEANIRRAYWGLAAGYTVAVLGLTYAFFLGLAGHEGTAQWIGVADLVSLVSLFLAGQRNRDRGLLDQLAAIARALRGGKNSD